MNRCKDCKHWAPEPDESPRYSESLHRLCSRMPSTRDMWKMDGSYDDDDERDGKALRERVATSPYCDDLSGMGSLMTPPDFGCVLWEPKQ